LNDPLQFGCQPRKGVCLLLLPVMTLIDARHALDLVIKGALNNVVQDARPGHQRGRLCVKRRN
jgi:hypothetical protein